LKNNYCSGQNANNNNASRQNFPQNSNLPQPCLAFTSQHCTPLPSHCACDKLRYQYQRPELRSLGAGSGWLASFESLIGNAWQMKTPSTDGGRSQGSLHRNTNSKPVFGGWIYFKKLEGTSRTQNESIWASVGKFEKCHTNTLDLILVWFSTFSIGFEPQTVSFAAGGCSSKQPKKRPFSQKLNTQIQWWAGIQSAAESAVSVNKKRHDKKGHWSGAFCLIWLDPLGMARRCYFVVFQDSPALCGVVDAIRSRQHWDAECFLIRLPEGQTLCPKIVSNHEPWASYWTQPKGKEGDCKF
jgi:hypothetical protein